MSYCALKYCILSLLAAYCAIGFWTRRLPEGEYYPFFSWILFDRIPENPKSDYTIRILAADGAAVDPPLLFKDAGAFFSGINNSPPAYQFMIRDLGTAIDADDRMGVERVRRRLEENFLEQPIRYEIMSIRYDPIAFWARGEVVAARRIASFESGPRP